MIDEHLPPALLSIVRSLRCIGIAGEVDQAVTWAQGVP